VRRSFRWVSAMALTFSVLLALSACGSSSSSSSSSTSSSSGKTGGTANVLFGTAPDSLDPQFGYTTQAAEPDWISYTGLLTYAHASGTAGGQLIPGLAESLPQVSANGLTYTLTLRKGLVFSDGKPVKASDFTYTIERALKLNWGGKSFFTNYIKGAADFDKGKAKTISGIKADDATGKITITLISAYGAFGNVIAFPSAGLVPTGTKMSNLPNSPPPGVGPYEISSVVPNKSFTLSKNPHWAAMNIPGIPAGHLDKIVVTITSNTQSEAQQVLSNQADNFDAADEVPGSLLPQIQSQASGRFAFETSPQTFYFFLNTQTKPFSNLLARQAVNYAVDKRATQRLASGALDPACYFLPPGLVGHPTAPCPYGDPNAAPDLAKAKQLVQQSGMAGTPVTVWGETRSPRKEYIDYFTSVLNQIGFKATPKIIADATYFTTIGNAKTNPQTGFADWAQDFPNPSDFYLLIDSTSIQAVNNQNFSNVKDPHVQSELAVLNKVPATQLSTVASRWEALDQYVTSKAYEVPYGYSKSPKFLSTKIDFGSAIFHPVYFNDWTSWQLK
jgi:peptide/nickel transport system substrate-binding protein